MQTKPVVVVTGGAIGIGAGIAEEFGRHGAFVVTMDPVVALDGSPQSGTVEQTTAERIVAAGGAARASSTSVTDEDAVRALFTGLVEEFGALHAVVNVAGISRPTGFASGTEADWTGVLDVHLNGYLTVLRVALPLMAAAGHGRILGVTSGSGWRAADAGAYSCAKRAVASLTWQVGHAAPPGVTVNALSPIAATRMVANALSRQGPGDGSGRSAASGGVALSAAPPPEHLGPIGAYLASDEFAWCTGHILFSNGAEVSSVAPPHVLEALRTTDVASVADLLDAAVPATFVPAETAQVSNGGSVPRLGTAFTESAAAPADTTARRCLLVADDADWRAALATTLAARGVECVEADASAAGFAGAADQVDRAAADGPLDAVVVALAAAGATSPTADAGGWDTILDEHLGITDAIRRDASWVRAVSDLSARTEEPVRVVTVTAATSAGGRSRSMSAAQLARAALTATQERVSAFAVAVESADPAARTNAAELVGHLVAQADVRALSGAELVADRDWIGLRSHPTVAGSVTYGGPELPEWIDGAVRRIVGGEYAPRA
jgi:NAD(P)-dependent dehydrogenase (short-subunit alcohol dehydrogenase family)